MPKNNKKKSNKNIIIISIVIIIALVAISSLAITVLTTVKERNLATKFVRDISNNRMTEAYGQFGSILKSVMDQSDFESEISGMKLDKSCELEISNVSDVEATNSEFGGGKKNVRGTIKCDYKSYGVDIDYNDDNKIVTYSHWAN